MIGRAWRCALSIDILRTTHLVLIPFVSVFLHRLFVCIIDDPILCLQEVSTCFFLCRLIYRLDTVYDWESMTLHPHLFLIHALSNHVLPSTHIIPFVSVFLYRLFVCIIDDPILCLQYVSACISLCLVDISSWHGSWLGEHGAAPSASTFYEQLTSFLLCSSSCTDSSFALSMIPFCVYRM